MTPEPYELIPTKRRRDSRPQGWVDMSGMRVAPRRRMTEGYLNTRMPRNNTIAMNQHYVEKVMDNPRTPPENRQAVIDYVFTHPDKFLSLDDDTPDPEFNEWARKKNAGASFSFLTDFRRKYLVRKK